MEAFAVHRGILYAEAVSLEMIADAVGTPVYVYSASTLLARHARMAAALRVHADALGDALIAFAVKANSNLSVLAALAGRGCGADTVSEGEMRRALAAGVQADRIILSGVGKTDAELAFAIDAGVRQINVESAAELGRLMAIAAERDASPAIAFRVNPALGAGGHVKITTGGAADKFGAPVEEVMALYARAAASPHLRPVGLACHIGSQIDDLAPLEGAWTVLRDMTRRLRAQGHAVTRLDLGGGLGVPYGDGPEPPSVEAYAGAAARVLEGLEVEAAFEPGRWIAAPAGMLLTRVIQVTERGDGRRFLVLDGAMNDLMRPTLYDAFHALVPVRPRHGQPRPYDVVGPVCETGDTFARDRLLPPLEPGDLVAFADAGAYGAVMASEYNSRPLVPEVLVDADRFAVVRPRPDYEEMLAREFRVEWL